MMGSNKNLCRSSILDAEDWGWSSIGRVLSGRMIGRSSDAMCDLHRAQEDEERRFLDLTSKLRLTISQFGPQNR
jgi:hypothetical protein